MSSVKSPATPDSKLKLSNTARVVEAVGVDEDSETFDMSETSSIGPVVVTRIVGCWVVALLELLLLVLLPALSSGGLLGFLGLSDPVVDEVLVFRISGSCNNF
jgi:hypothetical protein